MKKAITNQEKKNLRKRAERFAKAIRNQTKLPIELRYRGSLAKKETVYKKADGSFDLDFDIRSSFKDKNATQAYAAISKVIKSSLRNDEIFNSKENVIRVKNIDNKVTYYYDIAIFKREQDTFYKLEKIKNKFSWKEMKGDPSANR